MSATQAEVLLFNTRADSHLAARLHAATCPMVNTASKSGRRSTTKLITGDVAAHVADLNDRGFTVKRCKCVAPSLSDSELVRRVREQWDAADPATTNGVTYDARWFNALRDECMRRGITWRRNAGPSESEACG